MASKRWSVGVTDLAGTTQLHELTVEADNWMSALRSGRSRIGEEGGVPQGASCAVSPDGVVTILDPISRRKFVLSQRAPAAEPAPSPSPPAAVAQTQAQPAPPAVIATPAAPEQPGGKRRKFQTVAFDASLALQAPPKSETAQPQQAVKHVAVPTAAPVKPAPTPVVAPVAVTPAAVVQVSAAVPQPVPTATATASESGGAGKRKKFQTVAFDASSLQLRQPPAAAPVAPAFTPSAAIAVNASAPTPAAAPTPIAAAVAPTPRAAATKPVAAPQIHLLHQRSEEPTPKNPLAYRERSFVITGDTTLATAEAALRTEFAKLQEELASAPRGKFVNLALFDHRWQDRPLRPPIAALQWKDWKGAPEVTFPPQPKAQPVAATAAHDDRLATAFEALQDLPFLSTAAEGLEFAVKLLGDMIASEAIAACLYDINTDELRVVAAAGAGAQERKTQAIPVTAGLFGQGARAGDRALVIPDVQGHAGFDPGLDAAPGLQARNMLLRPLMQEGQLFGVLQLTNRIGMASYTNEDVSLINYIAERVATFVRQARLGGR